MSVLTDPPGDSAPGYSLRTTVSVCIHTGRIQSGYKPAQKYPNDQSVVYFTERISVVFFEVKTHPQNWKPCGQVYSLGVKRKHALKYVSQGLAHRDIYTFSE